MKHPLFGGAFVIVGLIALAVFSFPLFVAFALIASLIRGMTD